MESLVHRAEGHLQDFARSRSLSPLWLCGIFLRLSDKVLGSPPKICVSRNSSSRGNSFRRKSLRVYTEVGPRV